MNKQDNRSFILALALSFVVIMGWNYFVGVPAANKPKEIAQQQQAAQNTPLANQTGQPTATAGGATAPGSINPVAAVEPREAVLARSARVRIDTPTISGSIALMGGRLDDISLKRYREQVNPASPNIVLFSPSGSANPYYAEFGWVPAPGMPAIALPNASTVWTADSQTLTPEKPVTLSWDNGQGLMFKRAIAIDDKAMFTVTDTVENKGGAPATLLPYGLISRHGVPPTLGYYILHEGLIAVAGEQGLQEVTYSSIDKEKAKLFKAATGGFIGITDKYWAAALIPDQAVTYDGRFTTGQGPQKTYQADMLLPAQTIEPGKAAQTTTRLFAGAKEVATIDGYEKALGIKRFDLMIDWGWFYFITKPLFKVMDWLFHLTGNFGIAILLVTVLVKLLFFPLANKSYASMAKMKAVQPQMLELRDRYKDDKLKQQQELMELYKREKINPVAGCWPVLLQIPVFFALYKVLFVTIEMRHAPFFGWIKDLAAPDPTSIFNLFGLLPFSVPEFLLIGVWPILMGITMFLQMKMNPEPTDPIQKTMFTWMPVIFTFMLGTFPAGLVIYWTWNNLLSVAQQYYIMRKNGVKVELWDNIANLFRRKPADATKA
ncbi:MAG: membrane protein insertase YidC [Beijerinckiaceae bacterium]